MINTSRPSSSMSNVSRVASYETWATIPTTWASETRTWAECQSLMDNTTKITSSMTNTAKP